MGYREVPAPTPLRALVECQWHSEHSVEPVRVLPDGCMDLIATSGRVIVAGPDTSATIAARHREPMIGLRFRPGALPRLLGVPAHELRDARVALADVRRIRSNPESLADVAAELIDEAQSTKTAWSLPLLTHITASLGAGTKVAELAKDTGWSNRTLQRQCSAVYGYGPATLRRILRFRRAVALLRAGHSLADVSANAGYADQPHLHREVREFAGLTLGTLAADQFGRAAKRSTDVPSGSWTVA